MSSRLEFDKIALWITDFDGPTFKLKYPETEEVGVVMSDDTNNLLKHVEFSSKKREKLAENKQAQPDGSYPIRNVEDLKRAIQAFGRSKDKDKTKAWIIKRAKVLEATNLLPKEWLDTAATHSDVDPVNDFLEHFGVKGMKWGRRKADSVPTGKVTVDQKKPGTKVQAAGGKGFNAHPDAVKVAAAKQVAKRSTTDALSTQELQALVTRMNLEQQYSKLSAGQTSAGRRFVNDLLLNTAKQQATKVVNDQAGKLIADQLRKASSK